jgi:cysteine desulfurase
MVVMMLANNETGAVQSVQEVCLYCRQHNVLFATDAAQATGKISIAVEDLGHPDMVNNVGHKLGATSRD